MPDWSKGRGLLGPLKPLVGDWVTVPDGAGQGPASAARCTRSFRAFGARWIQLEACWEMGGRGNYREIALFGATADDGLGVFSFTNDGKRSEGRVADGTDVHPDAVAFVSQMPAGLARMVYWPIDTSPGFHFAVESRTKSGWNRFLRHCYRPA